MLDIILLLSIIKNKNMVKTSPLSVIALDFYSIGVDPKHVRRQGKKIADEKKKEFNAKSKK